MLTLRPNSLNWALEHALQYGDTDVFPLPFEYNALRHEWASVRGWLEKQDVLMWQVRPHRTLLSPKTRHGFRVITQLDPLDFLVFAAIVKELGQDIENHRVPISQEVVFSYRFSPDVDGQLFDPDVGYSAFQERSLELLRSHKYVAATDIADFYARIYHHRLENALQSATSRQSHVSAIVGLLSGWNETETFGIPVGNAPSRLLAEITIADIDEALLAKLAPGEFVSRAHQPAAWRGSNRIDIPPTENARSRSIRDASSSPLMPHIQGADGTAG